VTVDDELARALHEFGNGSRSATVRELALRGAEVLREERRRREEAIEFFKRVSSGELDDQYDWSVAAELHATRR
jgi:hypothetical protein